MIVMKWFDMFNIEMIRAVDTEEVVKLGIGDAEVIIEGAGREVEMLKFRCWNCWNIGSPLLSVGLAWLGLAWLVSIM